MRRTRYRNWIARTVFAVSLTLCTTVALLWGVTYRNGLLIGRSTRRVDGVGFVERHRGVLAARGVVSLVDNACCDTLPAMRARQQRLAKFGIGTRGAPALPPVMDKTGLILGPDTVAGPPRDGDDILIEMGFGVGELSMSFDSPAQSLSFETRRYAMVPSWFLVLVTGLWPAWWAARAGIERLHRRHVLKLLRRRGLCPKCGYDLRATPERCPECGTVFGKGQVWVGDWLR